ncbi:hypothetical protein [Paenibacillus senegalimassiliensis]|uniref:hypothetical protein n=1 Tax=Paenibacillus senegalimassiliensis TaxID=1737426 RepID=UPI00073E60DF|nr:hypothetical protein [Paenibacillus senegalimassiliensis]
MSYEPEREIRSILHDKTVVVFNTGDRVIFQASRTGTMPLTVDPEEIVDDLIITLEQRDIEIASLRSELIESRDTAARYICQYQGEENRFQRQNAELGRLQKQIEAASGEKADEPTEKYWIGAASQERAKEIARNHSLEKNQWSRAHAGKPNSLKDGIRVSDRKYLIGDFAEWELRILTAHLGGEKQ